MRDYSVIPIIILYCFVLLEPPDSTKKPSDFPPAHPGLVVLLDPF